MKGVPAGGRRAVPVVVPLPEPWVVDAVCAETDPEAFFPNKGESTSAAKAICAACSVRADCLAYAVEHNERFGVWGGLSERERRPLRSAAVAAVDAVSVDRRVA
jgi:WhiB family redox-sensing transcriptional regulator